MLDLMVWNRERPIIVNVLAILAGVVLFPVLVGLFLLTAFVAAIFDLALKS